MDLLIVSVPGFTYIFYFTSSYTRNFLRKYSCIMKSVTKRTLEKKTTKLSLTNINTTTDSRASVGRDHSICLPLKTG